MQMNKHLKIFKRKNTNNAAVIVCSDDQNEIRNIRYQNEIRNIFFI